MPFVSLLDGMAHACAKPHERDDPSGLCPNRSSTLLIFNPTSMNVVTEYFHPHSERFFWQSRRRRCIRPGSQHVPPGDTFPYNQPQTNRYLRCSISTSARRTPSWRNSPIRRRAHPHMCTSHNRVYHLATMSAAHSEGQREQPPHPGSPVDRPSCSTGQLYPSPVRDACQWLDRGGRR